MQKSEAKPFEASHASLEALSEALGKTTGRSNAIAEASLRTWQAEVGRYFDEFTAHGRAAVDALGNCHGPMEVLAVEQEWMKNRAQAYLESGMRFAKAFNEAAKTVGEETAAPPEPKRQAPAAAAE